MKIRMLRDRWRKAEKAAEDIISNEEKFVKLVQNGAKEMGELDLLYMHLAKRMTQKFHRDTRQKEKEETAAEKSDVSAEQLLP